MLALITQSKMPARIPTRVSEYPSNFQIFVPAALETVGTYENLHHWSNSQANRFLAAMPKCPYTAAQVASDLRDTYNYDVKASLKAEDSTMVEAALGKAEFNAFMFKEFDLWFSAFEAEAAEEGTSAEECWTFQTAKKLSKRTGLSSKYLSAVIGAWLLSHQA